MGGSCVINFIAIAISTLSFGVNRFLSSTTALSCISFATFRGTIIDAKTITKRTTSPSKRRVRLFIVSSADKKNGSHREEQEEGIMDFNIPVRCYSCNLPISGKWKAYLDLVKAYRKQDGRPEKDELVYLTSSTKITAEGRAMTELGLTRECCRRHFLTHPGV